MAMKSRKERALELIDRGYTTDRVADMFGLDEDEVIAAIHDVPVRPKFVREQIKDVLKNSEFDVLGQVISEKRRSFFREGTKFSEFSESQDFIKIENSKPSMLFHVSDDSVIIRKWVEGDYVDLRYEKSDDLMNLLKQL